MRVLVTGSEGYIGSVLGPYLHQAGHEVVGLDTCFYAEGRFIPYEPDHELVRLDIRDVEARHLRGFDAIVHLAALSNDPLGMFDPELTYEINHCATIRLANLAREAGVGRFLFSSSCSMYGRAGDGLVDETAHFNPQTPYAESKVLAERDLMSLARPGFSPVFLRNATAYGVSPRQRFDLVVPNLAGWAHTTGKVNILSDGTPWRPLVHLTDICEGFRAALSAPVESIHNQAFNVGIEGENYRVRDIAEIIRSHFTGSQITYANPNASGDSRDYQVSFGKIALALPGFRPGWRLKEGVAECARVFSEVGLDEPTFQSRLYTRLKQVRHLLENGVLDKQLRWS